VVWVEDEFGGVGACWRGGREIHIDAADGFAGAVMIHMANGVDGCSGVGGR